MALFTLGLDHLTAPLDVRQKVQFDHGALDHALHDLVVARRVREAAILSTCNRTEVYFDGPDPAPVADWLAGFHRMPTVSLTPFVYTLPRDETVNHAFRIASGLDSMVLGEPQILDQMKHAVKSAEAAGCMGAMLNGLFAKTFAVAEEVRLRTAIGNASCSMAAAAVKLAERIFPSIPAQRLLMIGAGDMVEIAARHFMARGATSVGVAARDDERDFALALRLEAATIPFAALAQRLCEFDIVVIEGAAPGPTISKAMLENALRQRRHAPMLVVDLGAPRDVDADAADLDDIFLYSLDDLQVVVRENQQVQRKAIVHAEQMIAEQTERFLRWLELGASAEVAGSRASTALRRGASTL